MIVVDTSALMAIVLGEPESDACMARLAEEDVVFISAGTVAEALVVSGRRSCGSDMARLIDGFGFEVLSLTHASARRVGDAYERWGKGLHPAGLNFGDCFAYVAAKEHGCPLLYVGGDFARTDIASAL